MHLKNHFCSQFLFAKSPVDANHRDLDDVGGGALNGCVHGVSLGVASDDGVSRVDVRKIAAASEGSENITRFPRFFHTLGNVVFDARISVEITVYELLRFRSGDFHSFRQAEGGNAIDDAKVGGLCLSSFIAADVFQWLVEDAGSGGGVNVFSFAEVLDEVLVLAQVRHDAQFDLRVVSREEDISRSRHESLANFSPVFPSDRYVLKIRVRGTQASCGGDRLVKGRVNAMSLGVDEFGQGFDVGAEEFFQASVCQNLSNDGVAGANSLKDFLARLILSAFRFLGFLVEFQFVKEHFSHLPRRGQHEGMTGEFEDFLFQQLHAFRELLGGLSQ